MANEQTGASAAGSSLGIAENPLPLDPSLEGRNLPVSPAFHPMAFEESPDTVLLSSDSILFYIHCKTVTRTQPYAFRRLMNLPLTDPQCRSRIINIEEHSSTLAVILHALYDSPVVPVPNFDIVVAAINRMRAYEIGPATQLTPQSQLYQQIMSFAPVRPLEVYSLAAQHRLDSLAVECSFHLVNYPFALITDMAAANIGTSYLLRLFRWKLYRMSEMKRIFAQPLEPHAPTPECSLENQNAAVLLWAGISAEVGFGNQTDIKLDYLVSLLNPHIGTLNCEPCEENVRNKIGEVIAEWDHVPKTIPPPHA